MRLFYSPVLKLFLNGAHTHPPRCAVTFVFFLFALAILLSLLESRPAAAPSDVSFDRILLAEYGRTRMKSPCPYVQVVPSSLPVVFLPRLLVFETYAADRGIENLSFPLLA